MAKYIAQPVVVDAFVINEVGEPNENGNRIVTCSEDRTFVVSLDMLARITPQPGDYVVVQQADGYTYLNPKDVFERKYARQDDLLDGRTTLSDGTRFATEPYRDIEELKRRGLVDAEGKPL